MSDLVKRLRTARYGDEGYFQHRLDAADEIERLTAALKRQEDLIDYKERQIMKERHRRIKAEKRAALQESEL
jgi:hypothetical protein